jgi:colanic acid/amylovoran biosynthesis protein
MKKFYFNGQHTFSNRGCEAIVRSTAALIRKYIEDSTILVPSININTDKQQWPQASDYGVDFTNVYFPAYARFWVHAQRLPVTLLKQAGWPFPMPKWLKEQITGIDAVFSVGGDNYSLDYRLPSLIMGVDALAVNSGKKVYLWGASVGPFDTEPKFIPKVKEHLASMDKIIVREKISFEYLTQELGLSNVQLASDPAFSLEPEPTAIKDFWPDNKAGVLGINVSPLLEKYRRGISDSLLAEVAEFIRYIVTEKELGVLLIPHVIPLDGSQRNNDMYYMRAILKSLSDLGRSVTMMGPTLNAAQIKYVISKCNFFVGARTHATIAAFSTGVPTISISYSIKAEGLNEEIFGHKDYVLKASDIGKKELVDLFENLYENEMRIKQILNSKIPDMIKNVDDAMKAICINLK